jgi:hypothetical protein
MEIQRALAQIGDIRLQMRRTRLFRGYTAPMTLGTAFIAAAAALSQSLWIGNAADHPLHFAQFWMSVAAGCMTLAGVEVARKYRESDSSLQCELTVSAVEHLAPSLCVGGLLTFVLCRFAPASLWMLPGLWQILLGLGIINSRKLLPAAVILVGLFYISCGLINLANGPSAGAFAAWRMGVPFGAGQAAAAMLLRRNREDDHAE